MIQSILIEIRPGLRTCSVCIVLKEVLRDLEVRLRKNMILISFSDQNLTIPFDFEVEPLTISCFNVDKNYVHFRIGVVSGPNIQPQFRIKNILPVPLNEPTKLVCKCGCPITDDVIFKRVLPLPSQGLDLADMFCHFDNHMNTSMEPRPSDCLYGIHYISVNKQLLENVKISSLIKCRRCLGCLGLCKKECVQLWNICLDLPCCNLTPVEEFKRIVKCAVEDSFMIFLKLFLECVEGNNGLLISVVDKQLLVSRAKDDLKLKTGNVLKLKYEYYKTYNSKLRKYLEQEDVQCIEVPSVVLNEGLNFLMNSTEEMSPLFRTVDGKMMAYLDV